MSSNSIYGAAARCIVAVLSLANKSFHCKIMIGVILPILDVDRITSIRHSTMTVSHSQTKLLRSSLYSTSSIACTFRLTNWKKNVFFALPQLAEQWCVVDKLKSITKRRIGCVCSSFFPQLIRPKQEHPFVVGFRTFSFACRPQHNGKHVNQSQFAHSLSLSLHCCVMLCKRNR